MNSGRIGKLIQRFLLIVPFIVLVIGCNRPEAPVFKAQVDVVPTLTQAIMAPIATPEPSIPAPINIEPTLQRKLELMAVGDMMLDRKPAYAIKSIGLLAPFEQVASTLSSADISIGNLECAITERGTAESKTYTFRAPTLASQSLQLAGFDLLTLANNHSLDYGEVGLMDTLGALQSNQILTVGAGENKTTAFAPVIIEKNGIKLAFLAYLDIQSWRYDYQAWEATNEEPGIAWGHPEIMTQEIRKAKQLADFVIVLMHFGMEGEYPPTQQQVETAHNAIDSGALLVIGAHTHLLQPIEEYNNGLIAYSLGNFVFDGFASNANKSAILHVTLSTCGIESHKLIPVEIDSQGFPNLVLP